MRGSKSSSLPGLKQSPLLGSQRRLSTLVSARIDDRVRAIVERDKVPIATVVARLIIAGLDATEQAEE